MRHGGGRYKNWEMSNTKSRLTGRGGAQLSVRASCRKQDSREGGDQLSVRGITGHEQHRTGRGGSAHSEGVAWEQAMSNTAQGSGLSSISTGGMSNRE